MTPDTTTNNGKHETHRREQQYKQHGQKSNVRIIGFGDGRLNPLGARTRQRLLDDLEDALNDAHVSSIVVMGNGGGSNFSAGADLTEFDSILSTLNGGKRTNAASPPKQPPSLIDVVNAIEASHKPIVAAIQGVALGGGLEVALACHYRIAAASKTAKPTLLGLPEVKVGVIPGAGGTQRLPKLVGLPHALDMILTAKPVSAQRALEMGLVDALSSQQQTLLPCAIQWAEWAALLLQLSSSPLNARRLSQWSVRESPAQVRALCREAIVKYKLPPPNRGGHAVHCALQAIEACCSTTTREEGMQREQELFLEALAKGAGQRHAFFAVRAAQKSQSEQQQQQQRHVLLSSSNEDGVHVGVIGAGTMGSGIALVLLQAGYTVRLIDIQQSALEKGLAFMKRTIESMVTKKRVSPAKAEFLVQQRLLPSSDLNDLEDCLLVVEAVVEKLDVKQDIFATLGKVVSSPNALLLSNTSTLNMDEIASALPPQRRPYCAGWHFFSPAHVMKLVEIVVAKHTSTETVGLLQQITKQRLGKIGVTVGNCDGFVGNRMLAPYTGECCLLLAHGEATVESVDSAIYDFGMPMGVFAMSDLAGNDIGYFIRKEKGLVKDPTTGVAPNRKPGMRYTDLGDDLVAKLGRVGQKAGRGWYDYDPNVGKGRKPIPSHEVASFIQSYVRTTDVDNNSSSSNRMMLTSNQIIERVLFPLVNEGFKILDEGIAAKPSDIDVVYLYGYGWPSWKGGPMFWADHEIGLPYLLERLQQFHCQFPGSDYYKPSRLLNECVQQGLTVEEYFKRRRQLAKQTTSKL